MIKNGNIVGLTECFRSSQYQWKNLPWPWKIEFHSDEQHGKNHLNKIVWKFIVFLVYVNRCTQLWSVKIPNKMTINEDTKKEKMNRNGEFENGDPLKTVVKRKFHWWSFSWQRKKCFWKRRFTYWIHRLSQRLSLALINDILFYVTNLRIDFESLIEHDAMRMMIIFNVGIQNCFSIAKKCT